MVSTFNWSFFQYFSKKLTIKSSIDLQIKSNYLTCVSALQARVIDPMLDQCWASVYDAGSTLNQHWAMTRVCWVHACPIPCEIRHFHHDHTHLFGQHDDVVPAVVPLGHLQVQLGFLQPELLHLPLDLDALLLRQLSHDGPVTLLLVVNVIGDVTRWKSELYYSKKYQGVMFY